MPALVGHRYVEGTLEQVFADSIHVQITAEGGWQMHSWLRVYRAGQPHMTMTQQEYGHVAWSDTAYVFESDGGLSRGWVRDPATEAPTFWIRFHGVGGITIAEFSVQRPSETIYGEWRADAIGEQPLPQVVASHLYEGETGPVLRSFIVDSATFALYPTGGYTHRVWFSEWEGPVDGAPTEKRFEWYHGDFGGFVQVGGTLSTESWWLQNHTMSGTLAAPDQPLSLTHPFAHGETPLAFRYQR
ncbi:MAG: hypothetical protein KF689_12230 [Gemmatimonadaceae bacterium]|nr:hypothetical protein [Gemmatimonadaceae bacterium]MCW5827252.1 hypothetical protein [Gemmatimonadaceae bacterium]